MLRAAPSQAAKSNRTHPINIIQIASMASAPRNHVISAPRSPSCWKKSPSRWLPEHQGLASHDLAGSESARSTSHRRRSIPCCICRFRFSLIVLIVSCSGRVSPVLGRLPLPSEDAQAFRTPFGDQIPVQERDAEMPFLCASCWASTARLSALGLHFEPMWACIPQRSTVLTDARLASASAPPPMPRQPAIHTHQTPVRTMWSSGCSLPGC